MTKIGKVVDKLMVNRKMDIGIIIRTLNLIKQTLKSNNTTFLNSLTSNENIN